MPSTSGYSFSSPSSLLSLKRREHILDPGYLAVHTASGRESICRCHQLVANRFNYRTERTPDRYVAVGEILTIGFSIISTHRYCVFKDHTRHHVSISGRTRHR